MRRSGRDHQHVIGQLVWPVGHCPHDTSLDVEVLDLRQQDLDVLAAPEKAAQRRRNLPGGQDARRDLVQQRLEEMVVRPIHQRDLDVLAAQRLRDAHAAETATDDHHARHHR
jgi:hypothetical protein